ncbi:DUF3857 domain-containing protein [Winogradskyella sp.]|uniref:DUF3857 domain-containing protein n=1 Tax=Winogradskyella sp. TaxID=1883156 RepID=UPI001B1DA161|nr:DUF3857 domain-containing protein [Winogradskyella sp.]MBO6880522.1 DUF3857 domain-containing protein [Winogradskyella sp.]
MNQFFSKNKTASIVIVCLSVLFYNLHSSGDSAEDPFLTLCKNSDAYFLHSYKDVTYQKNWARYKKYVSINNKLVVNTTKGVENYAFLNLDAYVSNHLETIKIRTLKADGSIVELDSSVVFKRSSKNEKFGVINYPIPAVEPGDTIETSYVYYETLRESELMNYVDLYSNLPSLNSQYSLKTGLNLTVRYKAYNDFPDPKVVNNDSMVYIQFSMDKIKGIEQNEYNCLPCDKPYVYYTLEDSGSELKTWKDVYNEEFNFLTQPMALDYDKSSYYKRWKRKVIGTAKDSSKYHKFNLLHQEVLNTFKMEPIKEMELIKSSGYFLKEERFDPLSIRRFYRQVLEDLEIDYWAVFGRDKNLGPMDKHLIRKGEFGHIFFAYVDEAGHLKFLYPHQDFYMYQIDEIPTSLYSTEAVLVKPYFKEKKRRKDKFINRDFELAEVDSVAVEAIELPGMNVNHNYIHQTIFSTVDIEQKEVFFKYRFKISGGLSTEIRAFFDMLNKDEDASNFYDALIEFEGNDNTIQIDTINDVILNSSKPFAYIMRGEGTLNNTVTFLNDSLVSVSVDKLIQHNQLEISSDTSELNYYLDYSYSDFLLFNLEFPCEIEILGLEDSNVDYKSDFCEYDFQLAKIQGNQLKIQSNYKILKNTIPNENLDELKVLNEQLKMIKNKRLIVKLKNI